MKACVMSANRVDGVSKKTNKPYSAVVTHVVFVDGENKEVEAVWIDPSMLPNGEFPHYGQVISLTYDRRGYLSKVEYLNDEKCVLTISSIGADKH